MFEELPDVGRVEGHLEVARRIVAVGLGSAVGQEVEQPGRTVQVFLGGEADVAALPARIVVAAPEADRCSSRRAPCRAPIDGRRCSWRIRQDSGSRPARRRIDSTPERWRWTASSGRDQQRSFRHPADSHESTRVARDRSLTDNGGGREPAGLGGGQKGGRDAPDDYEVASSVVCLQDPALSGEGLQDLALCVGIAAGGLEPFLRGLLGLFPGAAHDFFPGSARQFWRAGLVSVVGKVSEPFSVAVPHALITA